MLIMRLKEKYLVFGIHLHVVVKMGNNEIIESHNEETKNIPTNFNEKFL